jgi:O-antigen/teichoic acid export membrane protein
MSKNPAATKLTFRDRATKGFAWNYFYKLAEFGFINLYTILIVRHFGPTISAPYAVFTAICTSLSILTAFAVDGVLLRYIQRISQNEIIPDTEFSQIEKFGLRRFLKTLFAFRILVVSIVSVIIVGSLFFLPRAIPAFSEYIDSIQTSVFYIILFLFAQSIIAFCTFSLVGLLETKGVFFSSLVARGLLVVGGLFFLSQDLLTLQNAIGIYVVSAILQAILLSVTLTRELHKHEPREHSRVHIPFVSVLRTLIQMISRPKKLRLFLATPLMLYGITTWGSDILSTILGRQPDILMMRAMLGPNSPQIGYYLSASIILLVTEYIFLFGLGGTLVSIFSKLAHDDEKEYGGKKYPSLQKARNGIGGFQNVVLLPLCAYMMVFAPDVVETVYGMKYVEAIPLIRVGLIALALSVGFFGGGMQVTSLVAIGKERLVFRNRLFWGITNIAANFFLIRSYGGLGAIIGTQFSNAFSCGSEAFFARKFIGEAFNLFKTIQLFLISSCAAFGAYTIIELTGIQMSSTLHSILGLLLAGIITLLLYFFLRVPEARSAWQRLRRLFRETNSAVLVHD